MRIQFVAGIKLEAHLEVSSVVTERMRATGLKRYFGFVYFDFFLLRRLCECTCLKHGQDFGS